MAFLGNKNLHLLLEGSSVIEPFYPTGIKNGAYELSLGSEVFVTDSDPKKAKTLTDKEQVIIAPGQFALLLTEESVHVPNDKIAFISIKATVKFKGLVNVSGFHVDPGFKGKLLFSVYNAGSIHIYLRRGHRYFPIWFANLDEAQNYHGKHEHQQHIPDDCVEDLAQGEISSPAVLKQKIEENYRDLNKEIVLLQKDHKARNYLAGVALGLAITILLKLGIDWTFATSAVSREYELRHNQMVTDSTINQLLLDKRKVLQDIDSLEKIRDSFNKTVSLKQ